jgi:hypothetical protein
MLESFMSKWGFVALTASASIGLQLSANAANAVITGTITTLGVQSTEQAPPEVVDIVLNVRPPATGCPGGTAGFEFSPASVTDAQTRKNMLTLLLAAKMSGSNITIVYDNAGAYCSVNGFAVPIGISIS